MVEEAKTITLRKPYTIGTGEAAIVYDRLELVAPNAGQYNKAVKAGDDSDYLLTLIQLVCKVPKQVVESIDVREMRVCDRFFAQFTAGQLIE